MTSILGISAFFHDSAAALIVDGEIIAAAQEERFSRIKHDSHFPRQAVEYCLSEAGIKARDLDYVGYYEKPLLGFDRLLETYLAFAPRGFFSFAKAMPLWLRQKLRLQSELHRGLDGEYTKRFVFTQHHESHAASAFFSSPFEEAAILTLDGVGEWATATWGYGRGNKIELAQEQRFPHSLGLLYSAFTYFCGFTVNSGEYKLMGLAPYGESRYANLILEKLVDLKKDGSFRLDMSYFNYCQGLTMTSAKFARLFGGPPHRPETPPTQREMDLAASIQKVTEEIILRAANHVHAQTGLFKLCMAGGVALNCVANGRLLREGPFKEIWIQPAAGDAGGALGTALFIWHQLLEKPRQPQAQDSQRGSLLGPRYGDEQIKQFLDAQGAVYRTIDDEQGLCEAAAELIEKQLVLGWFQGRMEFGPRALGCRSILGDARSPELQSVMNLKIKFRESFRPFAPVVLAEEAHQYFELEEGQQSPYMLIVAPVRKERRLPSPACATELQGFDRLKAPRSELPAITHVDYSARVQTVDRDRHSRFHRLIKSFQRRTGCPVLINTSFNVRGEPIVRSPQEAYRCFMETDMDALVLEHQLLLKSEQKQLEGDKGQLPSAFALD